MTDDDFFQKQEAAKETDTTTTPSSETFKLGDTEYSKEQLEKLVAKGQLAVEAEDKYKTDLTKVWPEYTKSRQQIKDLEERLASREKADIESKQNQGQQLSEAEQVALAKAEAKRLGIATVEDINQYISNYMAGQDILSKARATAASWSEKGIRTTADDLLEHMQETGIRDPEKAFKDKYEQQYDAWKEKQLKAAKPAGLVTESASSAGAKQPAPVRVTRGNLRALISERMNKGE